MQDSSKFSFPAEQKLKAKTDFNRVFKNGKKNIAKNFAVFFVPNNLAFSRLGIIIPKKNVRLAVSRNAFKRTARESFRYNQNLMQNFDIIVFSYRGADHLTKKVLREELMSQWLKLNKLLKK